MTALYELIPPIEIYLEKWILLTFVGYIEFMDS